MAHHVRTVFCAKRPDRPALAPLAAMKSDAVLAVLALAALLGGAAAANATAAAASTKHYGGGTGCRWGLCGSRCCDHPKYCRVSGM